MTVAVLLTRVEFGSMITGLVWTNYALILTSAVGPLGQVARPVLLNLSGWLMHGAGNWPEHCSQCEKERERKGGQGFKPLC